MDNKEILKMRLQAWIYEGVQLELEMVETNHKLSGLSKSDEDYDYYKRISILEQKKMEMINKRIDTYSKADY